MIGVATYLFLKPAGGGGDNPVPALRKNHYNWVGLETRSRLIFLRLYYSLIWMPTVGKLFSILRSQPNRGGVAKVYKDKMARFLFCSSQATLLQPFPFLSHSFPKIENPNFFRTPKTYIPPLNLHQNPNSISNVSGFESSSINAVKNDEGPCVSLCDSVLETSFGDDVIIEIEKIRKNSRKITARIRINACLETIWKILTDYERLADLIPALTSCELLERSGNRARLFQIGQQNLGFGLNFSAKAIIDCYENDLEHLPFGLRRDIEFKLVEGDFQTFEGKWSILQVVDNKQKHQISELKETILLYMVNVEPKLWLPVGLIEGIICKGIEVNLQSIRETAQ